MKKHHLFSLLVSALIILLFVTCRKTVYDRRSRLTFTPDSREYFGCRVNGVDFVSEERTGNVSGSCSYVLQYRNAPAWKFKINSDKNESDCRTATISMTLDSVELFVGKKFTLGSKGPKKNYGTYSFVGGCSQSLIELNTSDDNPGAVIIDKIDTVKHVVRGTFSFSVKDNIRYSFQISGGIFDRHFSTN